MSVFNLNNTQYKDGMYPLFCGESIALIDLINSPYPELYKLYQKQASFNWAADEVDLSQDRMDMLSVNKEIVDLMVDTLLFQFSIDSTAANSILPLFAPFISSPELHILMAEITRYECIHSESYSLIVQQTMQHPKEALHKAMTLQESIARGENIVAVFDNLSLVGGKVRSKQIKMDSMEAKEAVFLGMVNLYILERISFMSSFAVTFAISELGVFQGIGKLVSLIARDEQLHAEADKIVCKKLMKQMPEVYEAIYPKIKQLIDEAVAIELGWNEYLFKGRSCVGLTQPLLDDWVNWMSKDIYETFGIEHDVDIKENPLPYMESYLDLNAVQVAAQESTIVNYLVGGVKNTLNDEVLEF